MRHYVWLFCWVGWLFFDWLIGYGWLVGWLIVIGCGWLIVIGWLVLVDWLLSVVAGWNAQSRLSCGE